MYPLFRHRMHLSGWGPAAPKDGCPIGQPGGTANSSAHVGYELVAVCTRRPSLPPRLGCLRSPPLFPLIRILLLRVWSSVVVAVPPVRRIGPAPRSLAEVFCLAAATQGAYSDELCGCSSSLALLFVCLALELVGGCCVLLGRAACRCTCSTPTGCLTLGRMQAMLACCPV